jgi:hypothetical protein
MGNVGMVKMDNENTFYDQNGIVGLGGSESNIQ